MANREGEFVLEIEPGNEYNVVSVQALLQIIDALRKLINLYYAEPGRAAPAQGIGVLLTASPEHGSVRFPLIAAVAAGAVAAAPLMEFGANLSQISGFSVRDVFEALDHTLSPKTAPPKASVRDSESWNGLVVLLVNEASRSGYSRIVIEDGDRRISLTGPYSDQMAAKMDAKALSDRMNALEREIAQHHEVLRSSPDNAAMSQEGIARARHEMETLRRQVAVADRRANQRPTE